MANIQPLRLHKFDNTYIYTIFAMDSNTFAFTHLTPKVVVRKSTNTHIPAKAILITGIVCGIRFQEHKKVLDIEEPSYPDTTIRVVDEEGNIKYHHGDKFFTGKGKRVFFHFDGTSDTGLTKRVFTTSVNNNAIGTFSCRPGTEVQGYIKDNKFCGTKIIKI